MTAHHGSRHRPDSLRADSQRHPPAASGLFQNNRRNTCHARHHARYSGAAPSLDHHPKSLFERLDELTEHRLLTTLSVVAAALYIAIAEISAGPEPMGVLPALCHVTLERPSLPQVPFIVLALPFHPLRKKRKIDAWARAGWYREGFEPTHHDLRQLRRVTQEEITAHRQRQHG
ncbi:hypothetical protein ACS8Y6_17445 [Salinisphaera sp. RV14]|uniref:hypothetical protein n=1 Tax=unclassified Salinisphaera TaxID=2649847 RepID=UPI003F828D1A